MGLKNIFKGHLLHTWGSEYEVVGTPYKITPCDSSDMATAFNEYVDISYYVRCEICGKEKHIRFEQR